ncbi:MAG: ParB/RepB/Spo0J family partition protein [Actinomycetota bacterium]|nr:ParB/RepB/Spo0J family partition protein [Actinomycetota bacterium]
MKTIPVTDVRTAWPTARGGRIDKGWVRALVNADELAPIVVSRDEHQLIDGQHRLAAAIARGDKYIEIVELDVRDELDALEHSARANAHHGLPLTTADRRALVRAILLRAPEWSDRRVATIAGVSPTTAGAVRQRLQDEGSVQTGQFRVGRDARTREYVAKSPGPDGQHVVGVGPVSAAPRCRGWHLLERLRRLVRSILTALRH